MYKKMVGKYTSPIESVSARVMLRNDTNQFRLADGEQ